MLQRLLALPLMLALTSMPAKGEELLCEIAAAYDYSTKTGLPAPVARHGYIGTRFGIDTEAGEVFGAAVDSTLADDAPMISGSNNDSTWSIYWTAESYAAETVHHLAVQPEQNGRREFLYRVDELTFTGSCECPNS